MSTEDVVALAGTRSPAAVGAATPLDPLRVIPPFVGAAGGHVPGVHGDDPSCGTPAGNSHRVIGGTGTPTLTLDATGLARPTSY